MRCPKCGAKVSRKSKYCPQCGGALPELSRQNNENAISGKKYRISIIIFILIGMLLIIGIVAAAFLWGKEDNTIEKEDSQTSMKTEKGFDDAGNEENNSSTDVTINSSMMIEEAEEKQSDLDEETAREEVETSSQVVMSEPEVEKEITASMAYDDVLLEYFAICKMDQTTYEVHAADYPNTNHSIMKAYHEGQEALFYYSFYDLDQNGIDELLIGYGNENSYIMVIDGYAFDGQEAVKIIEERAQGGLLETIIFDDGSYGVYGGLEGYSVYFYVSRLAEDGYSQNTIFDASFGWNVNGEMEAEGIDVNNLTEEQYMYIEEGHEELDRELLNWQPLF